MAAELYSRDHVWARREGNRVRVGLSEFAQAELGELSFVELPKTGAQARVDEAVCVVDSLKSTSEVYAPVSGTIVEVNGALSQTAGLVNTDPLGEGWLFVLEMADPGQLDSLMSAPRYREYLSQGGSGESAGANPPAR